jgi:hypothetical protein
MSAMGFTEKRDPIGIIGRLFSRVDFFYSALTKPKARSKLRLLENEGDWCTAFLWRSSMNLGGFVIAAVGLFAICGAVFDWDWFMNHYRARLFVWMFGRPGARIFYAILGTGFIILGMLFVLGVIQNSR